MEPIKVKVKKQRTITEDQLVNMVDDVNLSYAARHISWNDVELIVSKTVSLLGIEVVK